MFDTMTLTKIIGALCGTLLIFLLGNWGADLLYYGGEHGEEAHNAYVIETDETVAASETVVEEDFATIFASADVDKGAKVFGKCKTCHKLEQGANSTGPSLFGVVERDVASVDGYRYSATLTGIEGNWTPEAMNEFLTNPKGYAKGTKMTFSGLKKLKDRANIIAYLSTIGG